MNLEIAKKTEAWKFSPISQVNSLTLKKSSDLTQSNVENIKIAVGPNEQQIHTVHFQDLVDSGTLEILSVKAQPFFYIDSNTERARLDRSLEKLTHSNKTIHIKILKSPQSILWIDPNSLGTNIKIEVCAGAEAHVLFFETDADTNQKEFTHYKVGFDVGKGARLELGLSQSSAQNSLSLINVTVEEEAHFNSYSLMTGGADYKRLEINVFQLGKNSSATLNGLNGTKSNSTFDYHSNVFHLNQDQETFQNFKAVCKDQSKSIFTGRVHLTEKASGASVNQINNNLLLGKKSSVDTQPELNIYQDNVKATHGATTSSLDENHIFYFSSRGFKPDQTKKILLEAFCKSTCENLEAHGIKDFFKNAISKELYGV